MQVIGTAEYGTVQHSQRATIVNKSEKKVTIRFKCPFELVYICSSILSCFFFFRPLGICALLVKIQFKRQQQKLSGKSLALFYE